MAGPVSEELSLGPGEDKSLSIEDIGEVYKELHSAQDKWFDIGLELKVDYHKLKSFESDHAKSDHCLREMLAHRIQSGGPLTWTDLCNALMCKTVGRRDLAEKIKDGIGSIEPRSNQECSITQQSQSPSLQLPCDDAHTIEKSPAVSQRSRGSTNVLDTAEPLSCTGSDSPGVTALNLPTNPEEKTLQNKSKRIPPHIPEFGLESVSKAAHFRSSSVSDLSKKKRRRNKKHASTKHKHTETGEDKSDRLHYHHQVEVKKNQQLSPSSLERGRSLSLKEVLKILPTESTIKTSKYVDGSTNPDALALLKCLGLWEYYPQRLQLKDALCVRLKPLRLSLGIDKICQEDFKELPWLILQKLMSYDSLCRSDLMPAALADFSQEINESDSDTSISSSLVGVSVADPDMSSSEIFECSNKHYPENETNDSILSSNNEDDIVSVSSANYCLDDSDHSPDDNDSDRDSMASFKSCYSYLTLHPVDCLLALILCSDDFLRQDLFSRLAKCQLAVPFILPDPNTNQLTVNLWSLRSIIKEWDCIKEKGEVVKIIQPIISYPMPIVTFIRIGKNAKSKSAILNEVISDSHYDHFFHRDCEGGDYQSVLVEGLVDMCWYLPGGKRSDVFPDAVTFLNLHGDARDHPKQLNFLSQISTMCFILLPEEDLELDDHTSQCLMKFSSSVGGITLLASGQNIPTCLKGKPAIYLSKKNFARIKEAIRRHINKKRCHPETFRSISESSSVQGTSIIVDEDKTSYKQGLRHATALTTLITSHSSAHKSKQGSKQDPHSSVKDVFLPLQGQSLWKAWAANDKELQRQTQRGGKSVNDYKEEIKVKKDDIRKKQLQHVESLTPLMASFMHSLLELGGPSNRILRNYFLQCLKLELNNLSRKSISGIQHKYQSTRKELSMLQENSDTQNADTVVDDKVKLLKKELEGLQGEIISSSFGLEHLFRELGQVYEAALASHLYDEESLSRLPKAAAELLIDGYPLELMDGDAAHVPLKWVRAVLNETTKPLNNPNIFVLSVLGLKGTGKSTMLNTTFGLQFNVSAGRCTRGAFMQLLPLDEEIRTHSNFQYVLIVDTEGLRAPALDPLKTQKQDNELATFVIGLANMTLINIYGEVPGDMDDILQTAVHAFIRMSQIKFSPSCQFVHQNDGASKSSEFRRAKFTKKLNQFTVEAAKQEKCEKKFTCFDDVIKFSDQTDVHHFPDLWKGDPPMAPVNPGYSHTAQMLKLRLVKSLGKSPMEVVPSEKDNHLHPFIVKVEDLWATLLKENFVFSFKNTLEIIAYNSLETAYSKWDWEAREAMLKWEQEAENKIGAVEIKFAHTLAEQKCKALPHYMLSLRQPIQKKWKHFLRVNRVIF